MPINTGALGIRPVTTDRPARESEGIQRREDTTVAGFRPQTNVALRTAISDLAGTLERIATSEKLGMNKIPNELHQIIRNILEQSLSVQETLGKGIGSTTESQRFSMDMLSTFGRMLYQLGSLADKGFSMKLSPETQLLLSQFKNLVVGTEGGSSLEPVLLSKSSFELLDSKIPEQLPKAMYEILSQLSQPLSMTQTSNQPNQESDIMNFLNKLVKFFIPRPAVDNQPAQTQQQQQGQQQNFQQPLNQNQSQNFQQPLNQNQSQNFQQPLNQNQSQNFQQPMNQNQSQNFQQPMNQNQPQNFQQPLNQNQQQNFQQPMNQNQPQNFQQPMNQNQPQNFQQPLNQNQSQNFQQPLNQNQQQNFQQPMNQNQPQNFQQPMNQNQPQNFQQPMNQNQSQNFQQPMNQNQSQNFQQPMNQNQPQNFQQPLNQNQPQNFQQPMNQNQPQNFQQPMNQNQPQNFQQPLNQNQPQNFQQPMNQNQPQNFQQPMNQNQPQNFQQPLNQNQSQNFQQPMNQNQPQNFQQPLNQNQPQNFQQPMNQNQPQNFQQPLNQNQPQNFQQPMNQNQPQNFQQPMNQNQPQNFQQPLNQNQPQNFQQPLNQNQPQNFQQPMNQNQPQQNQQAQAQQQPMSPEEFIAQQKNVRKEMYNARMQIMRQPMENSPRAMDTMKNLAQFLMKNTPENQRNTALLQNFINNNGQALEKNEARHLQNLLRLCQQNIPVTVRQAAVQQNLPDLPRLWAFMQMCDMAKLTSQMTGRQFRRAGKDVMDFANSMRKAMSGDNFTSQVQNQRSFQMMIPLYLAPGESSYPTYLNVYDESNRDNETGVEKKETWVRICILTDHIGAAELTFRIYEGDQLDMRFYFSQGETAGVFATYVDDLRESLKDVNLQLGEIRIGSIGATMEEY